MLLRPVASQGDGSINLAVWGAGGGEQLKHRRIKYPDFVCNTQVASCPFQEEVSRDHADRKGSEDVESSETDLAADEGKETFSCSVGLENFSILVCSSSQLSL